MATRRANVLQQLRKICRVLPDTEETEKWGKPHFCVAGKIFCGYGEEQGRKVVGFKLDMGHAEARVECDPRFTRAPYVGHKGWVSMDASSISDFDELAALIEESYRLIAPKRSIAKLDG